MKRIHPEYIDKILSCLQSSFLSSGCVPTITEISEQTGISKSSVDRYMVYMQDQGMITGYHDKKRRATKILDPKYHIASTHHIAVVGTIACGTPMLAEENIVEYIDIDKDFLGEGTYFALMTKGDSMINAGINPGDIVVIRQQPTAEVGQIVAALIDNEATLKRYYPDPENNRVRLHPENPAYDDIYADDCVIQGIAVKVFKDID